MYIPSAFRVDDTSQLFDFIHANGFAVLVTALVTDQPPIATHLPLMLSERDGKPVLVGHFAKANPQWQLSDQRPVLAIFHGPHSFISAAWYGRQNAVPTWNYVAVHVTGTLRVISDRDRLFQIVKELTKKYEAPSDEVSSDAEPSDAGSSAESSAERTATKAWSLYSLDANFLESMLSGIVGFEIEIDRIEGSWKLNQHHDEERRQRVVNALRLRGSESEVSIADLMQA
jgi:transcriptional regulator